MIKIKLVFSFVLFSVIFSCTEPPNISVGEDPYTEKVDYPRDTIRIEVLNGTDIDNLARYVADSLRLTDHIYNDTLFSFDVIKIDNWFDPDLERSCVVDRQDSSGAYAEILCSATGITPPLVEIKKGVVYHVTIIVGPDYSEYFGNMDSILKIW